MVVKKFEAASMEAALKLVKAELGPEALILSTQKRKGTLFRKASVEVTAAYQEKAKEKALKAFDEEDLARVFPHRRLEQALSENPKGNADGLLGPLAEKKEAPARRRAPERTQRAYGATPKPEITPQVRLLEKDLFDLGLQSETAAELAGRIVVDFNKSDRENPEFLAKVKAKLLAASMRTLGPEVFQSRRQWAAVGMPGAGKTTLLVKLALSLKTRKQNVSLVSCDKRKIIGRQELAAYAKLIKQPFSTDIKLDRTGSKIQLVDTPSLGFESRDVLSEVEKICRDTNTLLVLDASQRLHELMRVIDLTAHLAPVAIAFTRLDAIAQAGPIYELLKAAKLPLLGCSLSHSFTTPFQFFEPADLGRWIVSKGR